MICAVLETLLSADEFNVGRRNGCDLSAREWALLLLPACLTVRGNIRGRSNELA